MTFSRAELLALDPHDLAELLDDAPGDTLPVRAAALGLDLAIVDDRSAVERAVDVHALTCGRPVEPWTAGAPPVDVEPVDLAARLDELAAGAGPEPLFAGTFAFYVAPDGAFVAVVETPERGVERIRFPKAMIRTVTALVAGDKRGALAAMLGRGRRRREVTDG